MEFNNPSEIVKDLTFGNAANEKIMAGVEKLANAVKSTLGASGKCVIYEDALGRPVITKDGVTVAESVVLMDPVENIGATLVKEAARNTVREAGDGTTTSTVLAHSLLKELSDFTSDDKIREIKRGVEDCAKEILEYLDTTSIPVDGEMLRQVAYISTNNDEELGGFIGEAFGKVGKDGVVLMEESDTNETYVEFVEGTQFDSGLKSPHLITDKDKGIAVLDNPMVLIVSSPIPNIRKIQSVLEHVVKKNRSLLIVADVEQQPYQTLLANKVKGNIKVNIVDTVMQVETDHEQLLERIENVRERIGSETNPYFRGKLEERLSMLTGKVGLIYVGADSQVELKEKKDRVEDAIYATQAALKEGIVAGGGAALLHASQKIKSKNVGYTALLRALRAPFFTILENANIVLDEEITRKGFGIDATSGKKVNMVKAGIIDPVLVTKTALKNAVSVATTIISADCVISNMRMDESGK
jgi:chaperonin GroEL